MEAVKKAFRLIPLILLMLPVLALALILWPISYAMKQWRRPEKGDISFVEDDVMWYSEEEKNLPIIDSLIFLSNRIQLIDLQRHMGNSLKGKLKVHPGFLKFLCKEVEFKGYLYWRRIGNLDIKDYIIEHQPLLENTDELRDVVGAYISQKLPPGTSPWRIILIHVRDGKSVLLCRIKHSITDGLGLLRFLLEHVVDDPDATHTKNHWETLSTIQRLCIVIKHVAKDGIALLKFPLPGKQCNSLHSAALTGGKRVYWTKLFTVEQFTSLRKKKGVTVNDIAVTAICDGLSKYVTHMKLPPLSSETGFYQLRSLRSIEETLWLQNTIGVFITYADLSGMKTLDEMLSSVHDECSHKKVHQPVVTYYMTELLSMVLPIEALDKVIRHNSLTFAVSNLAGSKSEIRLLGIPIENTLFFPPVKGTSGITFSVQGYNGRLTVGTRTDTGVIADPKLLSDFIEASLSNILLL